MTLTNDLENVSGGNSDAAVAEGEDDWEASSLKRIVDSPFCDPRLNSYIRDFFGKLDDDLPHVDDMSVTFSLNQSNHASLLRLTPAIFGDTYFGYLGFLANFPKLVSLSLCSMPRT